MKFWQSLAFVELDQIIECAKFAEQLGFHGVSFGDHLVTTKEQVDEYLYTKDGAVFWEPQTHWPDPWVITAAIARETKTIKFLTTVYVLPMRDPFSVAKALSTAAVISDDRVILGIGVGWQKTEFDLTGQNYHTRGKRCDEQIDVIKKLTTGEMVEYHGEFYNFKPLMMSPGTKNPLPIFVGGDSAAAFRRAAQNDGWLGLRYTEEQIPSLLEKINAARKENGDVNKPFDIWLAPLMPTPDTYKRLEEKGVTMVNGANFFVDGKLVPTTLDFKKKRMEEFSRLFLK
jgi:probable F420-dependent oxidoreductase